MKVWRYILGLLFCVSCNNRSAETKDMKNKNQEIIEDSIKIQLLEKHVNSRISEPFQLSEIDNLEFTTGVGDIIDNHQKCDSSGSGFYGAYFLIDEDFIDEIGRPIGGIITIHSEDKMSSWKSTDPNQTIWEIQLKSDVISVWDSIKIGMTRSQIEKFGRENNGFCVKKGNFYYSCDFNNFGVVYTFHNDTLKELTVTRKCEEEIKN